MRYAVFTNSIGIWASRNSLKSFYAINGMKTFYFCNLYPHSVLLITLYHAAVCVYVQGELVNLTCMTSGGNPPPMLAWHKNNVKLRVKAYAHQLHMHLRLNLHPEKYPHQLQ